MTRGAIQRWAREGLIDAIKTPGGQYRFRREALSDLLKSRQSSTGSRAKRTASARAAR
jgi:excisionase family DNA binding protein